MSSTTTIRGLLAGLTAGDPLPASHVNLISNTLEVALTDRGRYDTGHIRLAGNVTNGTTAAIGVTGTTRVFGMTQPTAATTGDVAVHIGTAAAETAYNLYTAITGALSTALAAATHASDSAVIDLRVLSPSNVLTMTVNTSGTSLIVQSNSEQAATAAMFVCRPYERTVTAEDVTRGRVRIDTGLSSIDYLLREAGNLDYTFTGSVTITGGVIEFANDGEDDLAAGHTIRVLVFGRG